MNLAVSHINGCSLFLQIFYLDNVNLGALNIPDGTTPLIKAITMDRLRSMINADTRPKRMMSNMEPLSSVPHVETYDCHTWFCRIFISNVS